MATHSQILEVMHSDKTYAESGILHSPQAILFITSVFPLLTH